MSNRTKGTLCILASALGFAAMGLFVRLADDYGVRLSAVQKSFFRNIVALSVALAVFAGGGMKSGRSGMRLSARSWTLLTVRSVLGTLGIFGNFYALSHLPLGDAMMLNKLAPFFTVVFAWMFLGERAGAARFACVAGAFAGAALVAHPSGGGTAAHWPAAFAGFGGGIAAGAAYACVRSLGIAGVPGSLTVLFFSAFSTLAAVPFLIADFTPMTGAQVLILCGAGAGAAVGQFGVTLGYKFAAPRDVAVYDYINPVFAAILGFAVLGQIPDALSFAGYAVIIAMAVLMRRVHGDSGPDAAQKTRKAE